MNAIVSAISGNVYLTDLKQMGTALLGFKDYSIAMWIAFGICAVVLLFGIILVSKEDYRKVGVLALVCAVINAPILILSVGSGFGSLFIPALIVPAVVFVVIQLVMDIDMFKGHCFVLGEVAVVCIIISAFFTPETDDETLLMKILIGQALPAAIFITDIVALLHTSDGFVFYGTTTSSTSYSYSGYSDYTGSGSGYLPIFDARAELKSKLDSPYLSETEKQQLVKEHNNKYIDSVNYENGVYSNVYER